MECFGYDDVFVGFVVDFLVGCVVKVVGVRLVLGVFFVMCVCVYLVGIEVLGVRFFVLLFMCFG